MPVVINEFEAVAGSPEEARSGQSSSGGRPREIAPPALRKPLALLSARLSRVRAH